MNTSILILPLGRKRDLILRGSAARQIANLLGFEVHEQTAIAAAVFEIACSVTRQGELAVLEFAVQDDHLHVFPHAAQPGVGTRMRLAKALPRQPRAVDLDDLPWIIEQLNQQTPSGVFEEVQQLNQELVRALYELQTCQAELEKRTSRQLQPVAA